MKMRKLYAAMAVALTVCLTLPLASDAGADAAKKPALSKKKLSINVGSSKKLKIKNYKKKVTWKTSKASVAKLSAKKKTSVKITGKKKGSAVVTASYKQAGKTKRLKCKVTVREKTVNDVTVTPVPVDNSTPVPQPTATIDPNAPTPSPTPFPYDTYEGCLWKQPADVHIKDLFSQYFVSGVSTDLGSLRFGESAALVKYHFSSVTMGNENKMESLITDEATDEYPDGMGKANVDNYYATNGEGKVIINYRTLENVLSYCKANNLKLRYHAFVWHSQVREYFFLQDYNYSDYSLEDYEANGWDTSNYHKLADYDTMKKRLNDYISQVIDYIYSHGYGDVVYAYDVINEAANGNVTFTYNDNGSTVSVRTNPGVTTQSGKTVTSDSSPDDVMDMLVNEGRVPAASHSYWYATLGKDYLYLSYLYAYEAIQEAMAKYGAQFGYTQTPSLIYNDYNTDADNQIKLVNYINLTCNEVNGTSGIKYCDGIGLQSHSIPEATQENMIKKIADEGLEVQITELDENINIAEDTHASKMKKLYGIYMKYSKNGEYGSVQGDDYIGVTSVTNWGICDGDGSWGAAYLFKTYDDPEEILSLEPKPVFYGILQAGGVDCGDEVY